ncbi:MAG: FAD-dependent oxidoreductase [Chloroflexi bacterium]|nr:FAD-dependent oxidoreductase [Chloroflexota bacterium]
MNGPAADLVVVGAGTMGAWTALEARRAGWRTTLVDAYGAGHPRATSGDETRIIRAAHGSDALYTRWSREALRAWLAFEAEVGDRLFVGCGALWFAGPDGTFVSASEATLRAQDIPVERLDAAALAERWPQIGTSDLAFALHEPEAGLLMARRGVAAVARRFSEEGGRFELAWARPGRAAGRRLMEIETGDGLHLAADAFVFACGPWLPRLFPDVLGELIRVTKQDVCFIGSPGGDGRFAADRLPCWVDFEGAFYGVPGVEGGGMKIGPDRYGPVFDPSSGDRLVDPESVRLTRRYLARRFPALADAPVIESRVCQYETTPDTNFILDRHPAWDNVWIAGGGSGHGFKHGPVIGRYLADRLAGVPAEAEDARFLIDRPRAPATGVRTGGDAIVTSWDGY